MPRHTHQNYVSGDTPEYNYGPAAVLNAIDWVYPEWHRKAAAFVNYDSAMGARGAQQRSCSIRQRGSRMKSEAALRHPPNSAIPRVVGTRQWDAG